MLKTRLTQKLDIQHPILSAPMAFAAGGKLASAVSQAGGLGLIGTFWKILSFKIQDTFV